MQALDFLQTCTFYDGDVGDEMRVKINAFSKLYDISMTKGYDRLFVHNSRYIMNINYKMDINI